MVQSILRYLNLFVKKKYCKVSYPLRFRVPYSLLLLELFHQNVKIFVMVSSAQSH